MTIRYICEAGDTVIVEGGYAGTQTGTSGRTLRHDSRHRSVLLVPVRRLFTVSGGKIVRYAVYWDNMAFLAELGVAGQPERESQLAR
jgi:ketosteroid isomerase-like protein